MDPAAELRKELSGVDRNDKYQGFARALRSKVPVAGDPQRIVVDFFAAGALDRGHEELNPGSLLQIRENRLKPLFGRGIDHFAKVINVSARLRQLGVLCLAAPVGARPND